MTEHSLALQLRALKLPSFVDCHGPFAIEAERQGQSHGQYLQRLAETELNDRQMRKIQRIARASALPEDKTLATLQLDRLPAPVRRAVPTLCAGRFVEEAENVLAFGGPGRGKTHTLCAVGHELVAKGITVFFVPTYRLVQRGLVAKRELRLEHELKRLDRFDVVLLDDIGYVQQDREEMEVLFTFLAERYERRSVMITSNLVFSQWDRIFKDPMTTAAAIDRLVHHATILELTGNSFRSQAAKARKAKRAPAAKSDAND